jgi:diguanylate cyclase (GGDEF)-like protein
MRSIKPPPENSGQTSLLILSPSSGKTAAGDAVLVAVAQRLRTAVRAGDLVARLGGDGFAVVTADVPDDLPGFLARVTTAVEQPIEVAGALVLVGASIGTATADGTRPVDAVLQDADLAMYAAKNQRRNLYTSAALH